MNTSQTHRSEKSVIFIIYGIIIDALESDTSSTQTPVNNTSDVQVASTPIGNSYNQNKIAASVVNILCPGVKSNLSDAKGGSGTIFRPEGYILTNAHIVPQDKQGNPLTDKCLVTLPDPQTGHIFEMYEGAPVIIPKLSHQYDIAFMKITGAYIDENYKSYGQFPNTFPSFLPDGCVNEKVSLGAKVHVFGYPAISGGGYYLTLTDGIVSSLPNDDTIVTSAKVDHGSSGGLAVDENGCMIGIPSMISSDENESLGVIISDEVIGEFLDKFNNYIETVNRE
jgi:hypothetical protein